MLVRNDTGIPINSQAKNGDTVLHLLPMHANTADTIKTLLELGADPTIKNEAGRTSYFNTRLNKDNFRVLLEWGKT